MAHFDFNKAFKMQLGSKIVQACSGHKIVAAQGNAKETLQELAQAMQQDACQAYLAVLSTLQDTLVRDHFPDHTQ